MNTKFSTLLKRAYAEQGKNTGRGFPIYLSQRFGVTTQAARDWLNDKSYPRIETLLEIAADLGITVDELLISETDQIKVEVIPVLTGLANATKLDTQQTPESQGCSVERWMPSLRGQEKKTRVKTARFAVKHTGDSMCAIGTSFPEGTLLIFDITRRNPESGDYVAARLEDGSCVFRRYMQEGVRYLMPLNHTYENYRGNFEVIGTLDYAVLEF